MLGAEINEWAVLAAAFSAMVIGTLWYGPLFNKPWMAMVYGGKSPQELDGNPTVGYVIAAAGSLVTAFVLANVLALAEYATVAEGILGGVMIWAGFQATMLGINYTFSNRPLGLYWLDAGSQLATMAVMGAIIGGWQ